MYVSYNGNRSRNMYHIALLHKEFLRLCTYCLDNGVREKLFLIQALYTFVQVDAGCAVESGQSTRLGV